MIKTVNIAGMFHATDYNNSLHQECFTFTILLFSISEHVYLKIDLH